MILRACVVCGALSPQRRCEKHERKPWEGSDRREKVRSGSAQQKRARYVMRRDDSICHLCGLPGSEEIDHVVPLAEGGSDELDNLAPAHKRCHAKKSSAEAQRGRERKRARKWNA